MIFWTLLEARSRLYRSQILQVNMRWKALAEIYTMHSFAPFSSLNFFVKLLRNFRQNVQLFINFLFFRKICQNFTEQAPSGASPLRSEAPRRGA